MFGEGFGTQNNKVESFGLRGREAKARSRCSRALNLGGASGRTARGVSSVEKSATRPGGRVAPIVVSTSARARGSRPLSPMPVARAFAGIRAPAAERLGRLAGDKICILQTSSASLPSRSQGREPAAATKRAASSTPASRRRNCRGVSGRLRRPRRSGSARSRSRSRSRDQLPARRSRHQAHLYRAAQPRLGPCRCGR